ncbi:MAG: (2Fe-2S)-binding protein [Ignavibacteriales bacterium]|nr:(2Fe-2S)-binding protein [Ignavibacteriales bacterium]
METIRFKLNNKPVTLTTGKDRLLLWVLRTDLALTGTKYGCGVGLCGACTVLADKKAIRSCRTTVGEVDGKAVVTIEGLAKENELHPVQKAFVDHDALQCGYCTPGMILTACSLLHENPHPSSTDIIRELDANLCRCGAHKRILEAVQSASKELKGGF